MTTLHLNPDGPHSDDYTREVAAGLAECVRVLNHATYPGVGVTWPSTIYGVLGSVRAAVYGLDQLLNQCNARLADLAETGLLYDDRARDDSDTAENTLTAARQHLIDARRAAATTAGHLDRASTATSHLGIRDEDGGQ